MPGDPSNIGHSPSFTAGANFEVRKDKKPISTT